MNKATWETIAKPIVVLVVICLITSTLLAVTNNATAPIIAAAEKEATNAAYKAVLPEADSFTDLTDKITTEGISSAAAADNGAGYAVRAVGRGYGGEVPVVVGIDADGTIVSVQFMQNSESAGFGMKLWDGNQAGIDFAASLAGQSGSVAKGENGVDGISGATISTKAVLSAVNSAFACYEELKEVA